MDSDRLQVRVSPIFPVTDLARSLDHYAALGCTVSSHDDTYGFAALAGVELHLTVVPDHDPLRTAAAAYLHVPDADTDPDNNLLRFGSPLPSAG